MDDIAHTSDGMIFQNASSIHEVVVKVQLQNHRYQSFPEPLQDPLESFCPFRRKPIFLMLPFSLVNSLQIVERFLLVEVRA